MDSDNLSADSLSMDDDSNGGEVNSELGSSSSGSDFEHEAYLIIVLIRIMCDEMGINLRMPQHNIGLRGHQYIYEILHGNPINCKELFRLEVDTFWALCSTLRGEGFLMDSRREVSVEEAVAIFCILVGHAQGQCIVGDRFQHSSEAINRHVQAVINVLCELRRHIIRPTHTD